MEYTDQLGGYLLSPLYTLHVGCPVAALSSIVMDFGSMQTNPNSIAVGSAVTNIYAIKFTSLSFGDYFCTIK